MNNYKFIDTEKLDLLSTKECAELLNRMIEEKNDNDSISDNDNQSENNADDELSEIESLSNDESSEDFFDDEYDIELTDYLHKRIYVNEKNNNDNDCLCIECINSCRENCIA